MRSERMEGTVALQDNAFVKVAMDPTAKPIFLTDQSIAHGISQSAF
jgi:hypothetical protein